MKTKQIDFSKYSSFKLGGTFEVALLEDDFSEIEHYYLIGSCNNTLIGNNPPPLMMLDKKYDFIRLEENILSIGGATPSGKIASFCKKHNLANFEFLSHLPGKLGGLVYMNAGLKEYEIFDKLLSVRTTEGTKERDAIKYGYRYTDITKPILETSFQVEYGYSQERLTLFKKMRQNQPSTPSAGSCFKNPQGDYAGRLIEDVGLKGVMQGGLCFSQEHANFLVNSGGGVFEDAIRLIQEAQKRVYEAFGIWLECEIIILERLYLTQASPLLNPANAGLV